MGESLVVEYKCKNCKFHRVISRDLFTNEMYGECTKEKKIVLCKDPICKYFKDSNIYAEENKK